MTVPPVSQMMYPLAASSSMPIPVPSVPIPHPSPNPSPNPHPNPHRTLAARVITLVQLLGVSSLPEATLASVITTLRLW